MNVQNGGFGLLSHGKKQLMILKSGITYDKKHCGYLIDIGDTLMNKWREKLIADVFNDTSYVFSKIDDFDESIDYVISHLPVFERELVLLRYQYKNNIPAISKSYGISADIVKKKLKMALSHMRSGKNFEILLYGLKRTNERQEKKEENGIDNECEIDHLDISANAKNALLRSGFRTEDEIIEYLESGRKLNEIPGIGKKCEMEIGLILARE